MNELNEKDFYAGKLTDETFDNFLELTDNPKVKFYGVLGSKLFDFGEHKLTFDTGTVTIKRRYFFILKEEMIDLENCDDEEVFGPKHCVLLASNDEKKAKKFKAIAKIFHLNEKYSLEMIPKEALFNMEGEIIPGPEGRREMMEKEGMFLLK